MLYGAEINGVNTLDEYGLMLCADLKIGEPKLKQNLVDIPGGDGALNMSYSPQGRAVYEMRAISFSLFKPCVETERETLVNTLRNLWHGQVVKLVLPNDTTHYWQGILAIGDISGYNKGVIPVSMIAEPYKYKVDGTSVEWSPDDLISGDIVSFETKGEYPISALSVAINPVQDLHGYDAPWPAGGGKNLVDISRFATEYPSYCSYSGDTLTIFRPHERLFSQGISVNVPSGSTFSYVLTAGTATNVRIRLVFEDDSVQEYYSQPFTVSKAVKAIRLNWTSAGTFTVAKFQAELGNQATPYTPYSNLCPISGHTGLTVYRTGKNVFAGTYSEGVLSQGAEDWTYQATAGRTAIIPCAPSTTYTVKKYGETNRLRVATTGNVPSYGDVVNILYVADGTQATVTTPADAHYLLVYVSTSGEQAEPQMKVEVGSTATDFEAYSGNSYPVSWQTEAGTVYGGTAVYNGDGTWTLTANWYFHEFDGNESRLALDSAANVVRFTGQRPGEISSDNLRFSHGVFSFVSTSTMPDNSYGPRANGYNYYKNRALTTLQDFKDFFANQKTAGTPVQVCYVIENPQTYTLTTGGLIDALYGNNNMWADTGEISMAKPFATLSNEAKAVTPKVTAEEEATLTWGDYSVTINAGTHTIPQLVLDSSSKEVGVASTGAVTFSYREGSL